MPITTVKYQTYRSLEVKAMLCDLPRWVIPVAAVKIPIARVLIHSHRFAIEFNLN